MMPKPSTKASPSTGKAKTAKSKSAKGPTKAQLMDELAGKTGLPKKDVGAVLDALADHVAAQLRAGRPATVPGVAKASVKIKPATAGRNGINPFTKQPAYFPPKPERKGVKLRPVKALRDLVA